MPMFWRGAENSITNRPNFFLLKFFLLYQRATVISFKSWVGPTFVFMPLINWLPAAWKVSETSPVNEEWGPTSCSSFFVIEGLFADMGANLGTLPAEYNKAVHGPYDPAIYYGKKVWSFGGSFLPDSLCLNDLRQPHVPHTSSPKDVPLGDVKLKQVGDWVGRRDKSPTAIARAFSRSWFNLYPNFGSLLSYVLWMGNDAFSLSGSSICFWLHDWVSNFSCWTWSNWTGKKDAMRYKINMSWNSNYLRKLWNLNLKGPTGAGITNISFPSTAVSLPFSRCVVTLLKLDESLSNIWYFQLTAGSMLFFYLINYNSLQHHRNKKYHW